MLEVRSSARLRFRLLGEAALESNAGGLRISSQKGFALLIYLAMNGGRALNRTVVADLLWGDRGDASARQNLRQAIHTLRRDLGPMHSSVLRLEDQTIALAADAIEVDALQFAAWAQDSDPTTRARCLDIPWGPFLHGFSVDTEPFDEWVLAERHRLDALATRTFSDLAKNCNDAGNGPRAILAMERLIAIDPGEEDRHRRLISLEAHYRGTDAAIARAKSLAAMLKRDLDAEPEPATRALVEDIRACAKGSHHSTIAAPAVVQTAHDPRPEAASTAGVTATTTRRSHWRLAAAAVGLLLVGIATAALVRSNVTDGARPEPKSQTADTTLRPVSERSWQSPPLPLQEAGPAIARDRGVVAIAVLPIRSYSDNGNGGDLLPEMMTEDLTHLLSRVPHLRVISRQTMMSYRGQSIDAAKVGSELGVNYLIEGSATLSGDVLRMNVALIDTRTRLQIWSGRYERTGGSRSEIQTEILKGVTRELGVSVAVDEAAYASSDPDVHTLIFKGDAAIQAGRVQGVEGLRPAERYFMQALERDPDTVRAKIGLGLFHAHMAVQLYAPDPAPHLAKSEEILQAVLSRYPDRSEAHFGLGLLHVARSEMRKALASFERAVELNPSDAPAHAQIGRALARIGREREGLEHILYAMRLSPRDPIIGYWMAFAGAAELELGNYERAITYLSRAHQLNPTQPRTLLALIAANTWAGHTRIAREQLDQLQKQHPHLSHARLQKMYGGAKDKKNAAGILKALELPPSADTSTPRSFGPSVERFGPVAIAVMPFTTAGDGNGALTSVADSLTDDLTNLLSRVFGLRVISRQTMRAYRDQQADLASVGSELNVRYIVGGTIRAVGDRLRVNVEMVDPASRTQVWSSRVERSVGGQQEILDEIIGRLSRELQFAVAFTEAERAPNDSDVSGLMYKGWAAHFSAAARGVAAEKEALVLFEQVLQRRPDNPRAKLGVAAALASIVAYGWSENADGDLTRAELLLQEAAAIIPRSMGVNYYGGVVLRLRGKLQEAVQAFERTIEINPSHAASYAHLGFVLTRLGQPAKALEHIELAMRLGPKDPILPLWLNYKGQAELELERDEDAIGSFRRAMALNPRQVSPYVGLASALALNGRMDEAYQTVLELQKVAPHFTRERILSWLAPRDESNRLRLVRGIKLALRVAI